jgi:putative flippase GtrA
MLRLIEMIIGALPAPMRRLVPRTWVLLFAQFMQFGVAGVAGFLVDTAVVYALRAPAGLYVAGVAAYFAAVTATWWINRVWTFQSIETIEPMHRQWVRYAAANIPGLILNLGTYFVLIAGSQLCVTYPVLAVAAGAIAGMFANFILSRALVFR